MQPTASQNGQTSQYVQWRSCVVESWGAEAWHKVVTLRSCPSAPKTLKEAVQGQAEQADKMQRTVMTKLTDTRKNQPGTCMTQLESDIAVGAATKTFNPPSGLWPWQSSWRMRVSLPKSKGESDKGTNRAGSQEKEEISPSKLGGARLQSWREPPTTSWNALPGTPMSCPTPVSNRLCQGAQLSSSKRRPKLRSQTRKPQRRTQGPGPSRLRHIMHC